MPRFFEKISESTVAWYDGLTERERRMLSMFCAAFVIIFALITIYVGTSKLSTQHDALTRNKQSLNEIRDLEDDFLKAKEKAQRARMTIQRNNVSLFSLIQGITTQLGLAVKDLNEQKRALPKSDIVEISVRLNLSRLSIDKVTALIEAIETSEMGKLIKVTKLKVSKRFDEPDLLDLQMTVSTWRSA